MGQINVDKSSRIICSYNYLVFAGMGNQLKSVLIRWSVVWWVNYDTQVDTMIPYMMT